MVSFIKDDFGNEYFYVILFMFDKICLQYFCKSISVTIKHASL